MHAAAFSDKPNPRVAADPIPILWNLIHQHSLGFKTAASNQYLREQTCHRRRENRQDVDVSSVGTSLDRHWLSASHLYSGKGQFFPEGGGDFGILKPIGNVLGGINGFFLRRTCFQILGDKVLTIFLNS